MQAMQAPPATDQPPHRRSLRRPLRTLRTLCLPLLAAAAVASALAAPAGVAAYACVQGRAAYLLAYDPAPGRQAWGHLGGRAERGETGAQTALREFLEESNCAFALPPDATARLIGPSVAAGNGFQTFVLQVPFVPASTIAAPRPCQQVERNQWVWVEHAVLHAALETGARDLAVQDGALPQVHLWPPARASLAQARTEGVLPATDPCR